MVTIDTLVLVAGDRNTGKSTQIRSIFTQPEMEIHKQKILKRKKGNYNNLPNTFDVLSDMSLYVRLTSWHETQKCYQDVKRDITRFAPKRPLRYKIIAPTQITPTDDLKLSGEELFMKLLKDFSIRRGFLLWLHPNLTDSNRFQTSNRLANFIFRKPNASILAIDSTRVKDLTPPFPQSINARLICDLLFRA